MYESFYNFSGKPFQLTPDQRFYFNSKVHNRAMSYLQYGLEQKEGFIVITGAVGTGKTMLVRNLFGELDQKNVMAAQLVATQVEPDDMLRMICASFGLPHEGVNKANMLHNLESLAATRYAEGKRVLLVVDEAHNLPPRSIEELRMLSNYQAGGQSLFQSFILGQEEFKRTLEQPGMEQVRQRIITSYHLEPLAQDETRKYIEFRLRQVGWKGDPCFEDETYLGIHRFTGGIPRRINTLCDRLLLFCCLEEMHVVDAEAVEIVNQEMSTEVGHSSTMDPDPPEPETAARSTHTVSILAEDVERRLLKRIETLEQELDKLQKTVRQDRKLLKKAVLVQLGMEEENND